MRTSRKVFAFLSAALFVLSGSLALLLFNIERKAFDPETYQRAFDAQNLYERTPAILAEILVQSMSEDAGESAILLRALSKEDWERSIRSLIPPEELKTVTDQILDSIFAYLNNRSDSASLSLIPFKHKLTSEAGVNAVLTLLEAYPLCTPEQMMQMAFNGIEGNELPLCNPPAEVRGLITPLIEAQLQAVSITLPNELTLIPGTQSGTADDPRIPLNRFRLGVVLLPLVPLGLLFLLSILAIRTFTDWLKWWGWTFAITGGISSILAGFGATVLGRLIWLVLQQAQNPVSFILLDALGETINAVAQQILKPVVLEGLMLVAVGVGMIVVKSFISRRSAC